METLETERRLSESASNEDKAIEFMGARDQDNAKAIADGVKAWKAITNGKGPLWRRFNEAQGRKSSSQSREAPNFSSGQTASEDHQPPLRHPPMESDPDAPRCPFQSMAHFGDQRNENLEGLTTKRPESLPTPPPAQDSVQESAKGRPQDAGLSPPPSIAGSASKCPIRMLDERSPEEIAEYFEIHKHEIPRSHEICVKRYQTNEQSIRQLDAKYGNLVNMIQGLGVKHQPLLPAKEGDEEGSAEMDTKSMRKVEKWAGKVKRGPESEVPEAQDLHSSLIFESDRQGHFDRPLKEIRVGESPSRPWGISVPGPGPSEDFADDEAAPTPKGVRVPPASAKPQQRFKPNPKEESKRRSDEQPSMVFTGPVFIGYSAEQAASLIEKCGWDPQGPSKTND